jgi:hypothetical protein
LVTNLAFYEAAAQIIPVLFVVLVLEARFFRPMTELFAGVSFRQWWRVLDRVAITMGLVIITAGEVAALHVLDTGRPSGLAHEVTSYALGIEGLGAVWLALGGPKVMSKQSQGD